jgi:1,4-dihydroxy-2-naphthoyl-CoA hydrolase
VPENADGGLGDRRAAEQIAATIPYAAALGITLDEATPDRARGTLAWSPERCTTSGVMHGGAIMSLADTVGAVCAFLNLPPGANTATVESATNFFRGVRGGTLHAEARPLHVGRSFIAVRTELTDDEGRLVGQTTQTQAVIAPRPPG